MQQADSQPGPAGKNMFHWLPVTVPNEQPLTVTFGAYYISFFFQLEKKNKS